MSTMWNALTDFTKQLFGVDVVSSDLPEGVQHANRLQFIGSGVAWIEATRTAIINITDSGVVGLVDDDAIGLVNPYPTGANRFCTSNGATPGLKWDVCSKSFLDSALADNSLDLGKLHGGSASDDYLLRYDTATGKWGPSAERVASITGTGIAEVTNPSGDVWQVHVPAPSYPSVPTYSAGAGMTATGTTFNVIAGNGSVVVNADELHVGFDATVPSANGVAAHGDSVYAAAANHVHPAGVESVVYHSPCRVACVSNVTLATPGAVHRGLTLSGTGTDRLLLLGQTSLVENGIYVWNGAGSPLTRAADWTGTLDLSVTHCVPCLYASDTQDDDGGNVSDRGGLWFTTTANSAFVVGTDGLAGRLISQEKNVLHEPCEAISTRHITLGATFGLSADDLASFATEGYTLLEDDRVFLAHQNDPLENGLWYLSDDPLSNPTLSRPDDWETGSVIRAHTVHEFPIKRGISGPSKWFACKATDALIGDTVVGTGIACDWYCYGAGSGPSVAIWHPPAFIHGTKNYDTTAFPAACEGQTIVETNTRIVLTKQTNSREDGLWVTDVDNEDGTWTLTRPSDWPEGATLQAGTVHYINVEYGDLRPPHLVIFHVQSDTLIWGGSMTTGGFAISTSLIPEHDVIDVEIPGGEPYTFTPPDASETNRKSMIIAGIIYIGDEVSTAPTSDTTLLPLETVTPYDDTGTSWLGDTAVYLSRVSGDAKQGTYSWRLSAPSSGSGTLQTYRAITVPANCSCKVTGWEKKGTYGTARMKLGMSAGAAEYGELFISGGVSAWTKFTSSIVAAQSTEQNIYLSVSIQLSSSGGVAALFDAIQIDFIPDGIITSKMYVHQHWEPDSTPYVNMLSLVGDNAQHQAEDPNETWGDFLMYNPTYSDACEFALNVFNINRFLRATVYTRHWSVDVETPSIPTVAAPEQVYT